MTINNLEGILHISVYIMMLSGLILSFKNGIGNLLSLLYLFGFVLTICLGLLLDKKGKQ